jgi:Tol biopolymer transport system component
MHRIRTALIATCLVATTTGAALAATPSSSPDGSGSQGRIAYAYGSDGPMHVFTMAPDGSHRTQVTPFESQWGSWSPDGSHLAVMQPLPDGRVTSAIVSPDGSDLRSLPLPDDSALSLAPSAWSTDGTRLALEGWNDKDPSMNGIHVLDVATERITRLTTVTAPWVHDVPVSWSPDDASMLVVRLRDDSGRGELFTLGLEDGSWQRVTPEGQQAWLNGFNVAGDWTPDGASIAYTGFDGDTAQSATFVVAVDGGEPVQVSDWGRYQTGVQVSPDGQWLLYDTDLASSGNHQLYLVRPDGTDGHAVTDMATTGLGNCCGTWSPDGRQVLFQNGDASSAQLWVMGVDGSGARQVTTDPGGYSTYAWATVSQ